MLKGMRHTPCEAKYINEESLYLARDKDDIWRVGGFIKADGQCVFESKFTGEFTWGGNYTTSIKKLRELYQLVMPRGFERDPQGFSKIKIKRPNRKKNRRSVNVKMMKKRVLDLEEDAEV